jgi:hypothetical protein
LTAAASPTRITLRHWPSVDVLQAYGAGIDRVALQWTRFVTKDEQNLNG